MLTSISGRLLSMPAEDEIPKNCDLADVLKAQKWKTIRRRKLSIVIKNESQCMSHDQNKY